MSTYGFDTTGLFTRHTNSLAGQSDGRRRTKKGDRSLVEVMESRLLMSASYTMAPVAAFDGSTSGSRPNALVMDSSGNIFGTAQSGGAHNLGTVFKIASGTNTISVVAAFDSTTGGVPIGKLVIDGDGDLFGVTTAGGANNGGTIFEVPSGSSTIDVLASFDSTSGVSPAGGMVMDADGNLFGMTTSGGANNLGTLYELTAGDDVAMPLAAFDPSNSGGYSPVGAPVMDSDGNLFGATTRGGAIGAGVVFELPSGSGTITTLSSLDYATTGFGFAGGLIQDAQGNLYGAMQHDGPNNYGAIFKVDATTHALTVLAPLDGTTSAVSAGTLLVDSQGDLFGVSAYNGANNSGTIFELPAGESSTVLLASLDNDTGRAQSNPFGMSPDCNLIADRQGNLFGPAASGGANNAGTIFEIPGVLTPAVVATQVVVTQQPSDSTADSTNSVQVQLEDAQGQLDTSINGDVTISIATGPDGATLGGTTTVAAVSGVATFSGLSFPRAGDYTLSVTEGNLSPTTSNSFTISAGAGSKLVILQQPAAATTIHAVSPLTVAVQDAYGNVVTTDSSAISVAISGDNGSVLTGTTTANAVNGVATFDDLSISASGSYTLSVSYGALTPATSTPVVVPEVPTAVAGRTQRQPLTVDLTSMTQPHKNNERLKVSLVSGPDGAKLGGTTAVRARRGQASFKNLLFKKAGEYTVRIDSAQGMVTTQTVLVAPGAATHLKFVQRPTLVNGTLSASVRIVDRFGNTVIDDASPITLSLDGGAKSDSQLLGNITAIPVSGVAGFNNLTVNRGGAYHVVASDGKDVPAYSRLLNVL